MPRQHAPAFTPEAASASATGGAGERQSLPALQAKMKRDPEGYEEELRQLRRHFESSVFLFRQQAALASTSSSSGGGGEVAKELGDLALFLAHVAPFYPEDLADLPDQIGGLLDTNARALPSGLRVHLVQALILLVNRKIVDLEDTMELFLELQVIGDRAVKKLAFSHIVHSIRRMNQTHKNEARNRKLQNILFTFLQGEEESRAKRAFTILCDLHRRRVWFDDRTANAICNASFHVSSRIMIAAISFLLGYENVEQEDDSDASSSEDEAQNPQIILSKEDVYKANHKGTSATKKKKKAKLQRVIRSMKRQQRKSTEETGSNYYSPLTYLKDPQGFAEKLFSRLQKCNERFEVRMMMLKVIARTIGLHHLVLLNFYPYLQRYVQPHQRDVTTLLAAAVQACHDMVPPDAVEPLFKQIVNQFVHDRSRPEAIAVGLNVVREICMRIPLLMNEDLLQDLVLYKKSHEKAVSIAARSLITLFREICPSLLVKKDRGRPIDPKARPKAFGEATIATDVPGAELLDEDFSSEGEDSDDESEAFDSNDEKELKSAPGTKMEDLSEANKLDTDEGMKEEDQLSGDEDDTEEVDEDQDISDNDSEDDDELEHDSDLDEENDVSDDDEELNENLSDSDEGSDQDGGSDQDDKSKDSSCKANKRKLSDYIGQLNAADASLRALKKLAGVKKAESSCDEAGKILSDEDFKRIKELKARKEAKLALAQHGLSKGSDTKSVTFKMPSSDQLSMKRVDPSKLEAHIKRKLTKEERLEMVKAGREDRGKYQARTAVKQKKTGGLSNRQKQHKKRMPLAASRAKAARSRQEKKEKQKRSGKQFRGRKAWK
ncbi:protein SDA1 homolog [Oryza brachyantha]|uniref:Protein SDA1 n=1 Tax=Oryza brachyantha TaxID=4533 RepID=J3M1P2_ORYBR|nr:protein SDA1 homolog [Oryza brachyantha]